MLKRFKENYSHDHIQFIVSDADGRVVDSDQTILNCEKGSPLGELHPFFLSMPAILASAGKSTVFRCVQLGTSEDVLTVDIDIVKEGECIHIVIYDLTDHYREYQSMAQSRNESVIASELILLKNDELQERERFKNEFIQNFSHELRNPLTNIISLTNILGRTGVNEEQQRILKILKESTFNLKLMLEDILSLSMISKGKLALNSSIFDFGHLIDFLKLTYTTRAEEKNLEFSITSDEGIPDYLEGDRLRLLQVLTNLCDNAIKYTETGKITMHVGLNQKRANTVSLRFGVEDTGIGIPPESLETIFESFEQLGRTEGVGLGLAIVKGLLALMGSTIQIDSTAGSGSHFYFDVTLKFPLRQPEPISNFNSYKRKPGTKKEEKFNVLLVEDDEQVKTALFKILIDAGDFFVDVVSDGALAVGEIVNRNYDLVLMDVNLPNVSGVEVVKVIRNLPSKNLKTVPVIGITAYSYEEQIKTCLQAGMNAVIAKPFDEEELLEAMQNFLKGRKKPVK